MPKYQRSRRTVVQTSTKRPVDKKLITVGQALTASQINNTIYTATFPGTVTGLRWDIAISSENTDGATSQKCYWVIARVKDGIAAGNMSVSPAGSNLYTPEQEVLAFGVHNLGINTGDNSDRLSGSTKTMRKLMGGDKLVFSILGGNTNMVCEGVIQFFIKS